MRDRIDPLPHRIVPIRDQIDPMPHQIDPLPHRIDPLPDQIDRFRSASPGGEDASVPVRHGQPPTVNCQPLYRFTQTLFVCVYFSSASLPWSRPKPDSLKPPKG